MLHPNAGDDLSELARRDAVDVLLSGDELLAKVIAARWGLTTESLVVAKVRSRSRALLLGDVALHWAGEVGIPPVLSEQDSAVTVILPLSTSHAQADLALSVAIADGLPLARFGELARTPSSSPPRLAMANRPVQVGAWLARIWHSVLRHPC